jgi:hypothetical protein
MLVGGSEAECEREVHYGFWLIPASTPRLLCSMDTGFPGSNNVNSKLKATIISIVISIVFGLLLHACLPYPVMKFKTNRWRNGGKKGRGAMVYDIIDRKLLIGNSEREVIEILGEPDWTYTPHNLHAYSINNNLSCLFWDCSLFVYFDAKTKRVDGAFKAD